ncbi:MAG: hypothetical protein IJV15_12395 [Lachnospiraceae bacterium]|nr:hypothetical protein [Lachnospiraceae bacterium]
MNCSNIKKRQRKSKKRRRALYDIGKKHVKDNYAVIVIDNSDIAKPSSKKLEALTDIRDGSTGEITKGYQTIEAAVLSESNKMPLPIYQKVFSAAEEGFVSETQENLALLKKLVS